MSLRREFRPGCGSAQVLYGTQMPEDRDQGSEDRLSLSDRSEVPHPQALTPSDKAQIGKQKVGSQGPDNGPGPSAPCFEDLVAMARGNTPDPIPNSAVKTLSADGTAS